MADVIICDEFFSRPVSVTLRITLRKLQLPMRECKERMLALETIEAEIATLNNLLDGLGDQKIRVVIARP